MTDDTNALFNMDDSAFRAHVRDWIERNYPAEVIRFPSRRLHWHEVKPWFDRLSQKGWIAPGWPLEHGGMGLSGSKQLIMIEELERFGAARVNDQGLIMLGPLLIRYGTDEQKALFLPRILSGEHVWAQAYSEPNAGSDLAALRLEAKDMGDYWLLNGQKTWVTLGGDANWIFLLARTDNSGKKQQGISFLLTPADAPGITVRPIVNLDMGEEFSEMFFDDVQVPKELIVGEVHKGWTYAKDLLGFERIAIGSPKASANAIGRLERMTDLLGKRDDPTLRAALIQHHLDLEDLKALYAAISLSVKRGEPLGPEVTILKIAQTELFQRITDTMIDLGAEHTALTEPMGEGGLHPSGQFLLARPATIFGGSSEILRNIIARNVLGLPA